MNFFIKALAHGLKIENMLFFFNKEEIQNEYTLLGLRRILNIKLVMLFIH